MTLAIVCVLVSLAFLGVAASSYFRSGVSRQLDGLIQGSRLVDLAESAIAEVASGARMNRLLEDPARAQVLEAALTGGELRSGVLVPAPGTLETRATGIDAWVAADPSISIGPVRIRPVEYLPFRNKGRLRFSVLVESEGGVRRHSRSLAHDYEFSVYLSGGRTKVLMAPSPLARIYP